MHYKEFTDKLMQALSMMEPVGRNDEI
jgi:hypothetical protein